ncbi:MAG: glycosyltransferase family 2 protein [Clostridium sp.]|nr:glycosyltransferase family 2 protein [Clostridium sp.]
MISVILPAFNREKFIEDSIASVLNQTYSDFELLVVDDGSEDSTVEIVERLMNKDRRIKLIKASHQGVSAARNLAIDNANGEFIFFVDSDDFIHPDLLKTLMDKMADKDINMAFCRYMQLDEQQMQEVINSPALPVNKNPHFEEYSEEAFMKLLIEESFPNTGAIGGRLFRKSVIDGIRFNSNLIYTEDTFFVYEYALCKGKTAYCDEKLYYYLQHGDNSIKKWESNFENYEPYVKAFYLMSEREAKRGRYDYAQQWNKKAYLRLCTYYHLALRKGKLRAANKISRKLLSEIRQTTSAKWRMLYIVCFINPNVLLFMQRVYYSLRRKDKGYD